MVRQPTTKLEISGHRFLLRRMEHALVRGDVRMLDDPIRAQSLSLIVGCALAVIGLAVCATLGILQPRGALGTAPIVMIRDSGALYVRIGDEMHPALNLASARLITGSSERPELVSASAIDHTKRGPLVGIPGAPDSISAPLGAAESDWTVCEDATTTTVMVGITAGGLDDGQHALVAPRGESAATAYLIYDGRRARVDLRNPAVVRALNLDGVTPRQVSRALLDMLIEVPDIAAPAISGGLSRLRDYPVGTVLRLNRAGVAEYYVALAGGVQRIGEVAADLIRFTQPRGRRDIVTVAPGVVGTVPIVDELPVAAFPERGGVTDRPVICSRWRWSATAKDVSSAVLVGDSMPPAASVRLAQADQDGPGIDTMAMASGRSAYVRAVSVTGDGGDTGTRYLVTDSGVVYGVHDDDAAKRLGLTSAMVPGPWPLLARLPRGPELSVQAASVARDSVGPPT